MGSGQVERAPHVAGLRDQARAADRADVEGAGQGEAQGAVDPDVQLVELVAGRAVGEVADQAGPTTRAVLESCAARDRDRGRVRVGDGGVRVVAALGGHLLPLLGRREREVAVLGENQRAAAAHGQRAPAAEQPVVRRRPGRHGDHRVAGERDIAVREDVGGRVPAPAAEAGGAPTRRATVARAPTAAEVLWVWLRTSPETCGGGADNRNLATVFVARDPLTFP